MADARKALGYAERKDFAELVGLKPDTLGSYERGVAKPDMDLLAAYRQQFGISLSWLIANEGDMFADPSKAPAPATVVDPWVMGRAYSVIERVCRELGRPVSGSQLAEEAATLYSALLGRIVDVRDKPMVEAALAVLADEAKERMISAKPGSGKWSASSS
ncbi:helix-turn-helix domain-containing protein [Shinella kummerowiae]|uniref:helix-turn-helix domain-containing protein n=1 Tax=Shinella kummerowiae TaxID=417745 RepID=UPI0021B62A49|nr:helix-turn-helix transcriptional regulator [Shinella kummerowiae]MCT7667655.1 helix-turn-helix transcriptional regulator [Shinella kummerowiae]